MTRLKDKFSNLHLKPYFKVVSKEIERLKLQFGHMLLAQEISVSVALIVKYRTCPLRENILH